MSTAAQRRNLKELEEARKAGTAEPEKDENGRDINPHIPQYIAKAPWYLNVHGPSLKHQRPQKTFKDEDIKQWYTRGEKLPSASKYRKGACTNCGAITHQVKDCVDRPRAVGAKFSNRDIRPDEVIHEISLGYEGKRDRWNGYDATFHALVLEQYDQVEMEKRRQKQEQMQGKFMTEPDAQHSRYANGSEEQGGGGGAGAGATERSLVEKDDVDDTPAAAAADADAGAAAAAAPAGDGAGAGEDGEEDEYKETEGYNNAPIGKIDPKTRTTIRNLRIREDTAKYLRNLDPDSAHYDPKSRSMRGNPNPNLPPEEQMYIGDTIEKETGDTSRFEEMNRFAWEAYERGQDVHVQALPSQAALLHQQFQEKKEQVKKKQRDALLGRYGGAEHLEDVPKELLLSESDIYVEYNRQGRVIKGNKEAVATAAKSKYDEDVMINNHTTVWGSWWKDGRWGFGCCHSTLKNSYCTGERGKRAAQSVLEEALQHDQHDAPSPTATASDAASSSPASPVAGEATKASAMLAAAVAAVPRRAASGGGGSRERAAYEREASPVLNEGKVVEAMKRQEREERAAREADEKKRSYNSSSRAAASTSSGDVSVTAEEMEAFKRRRTLADDPMAAYIGKDT